MNERVRRHFDEIEARLIECPAILSYKVIRRDISPDGGKTEDQDRSNRRGSI